MNADLDGRIGPVPVSLTATPPTGAVNGSAPARCARSLPSLVIDFAARGDHPLGVIPPECLIDAWCICR